MDVNQYLQRINYKGSIQPTAKVLSQLQFMHLMNVPFENLDIQNHVKIDLQNLFDKIVMRKRGGFCYELNGLFYQLLKEIGFKVKMISARVFNGKDYSPEFDHMALIVTINNDEYLTDVGFGAFAMYPLKIELNEEINDPAGIFKFETLNKEDKVVKKKNADGMFIPEYKFSETERSIEEFYSRCNYHQSDKESHFMKKIICSRPTTNGRITLTGNSLKITEHKKVIVTQLAMLQMPGALWKYFGIKF